MNVFTKLNQYSFNGSFEGWIRRIMINESISFLRSRKEVFFVEEILDIPEISWNNVYQELDVSQIQHLIDKLPSGYKMVFVLYAIEGYKHKEIAEILNIKESTSKSQLFKARKMASAANTFIKYKKSWHH